MFAEIQKVVKTFKDLLPIYGLLTYGIGYTFLWTYYSVFTIDIGYYVSITDFLLFSLSVLITYTIFLLLVQFIIKGIVRAFYQIEYEKLERENKVNEIYKREYTVEMICFFFAILVAVIAVIVTKLELFIMTSLIVILSINLTLAAIKSDKQNNRKVDKIARFNTLALVIGAILIIAAFLFGWNEAKKSKKNTSLLFHKKITFTTSNQVISTNDSIFFIGETSNYLFLYNKKADNTTIFNKSSIENLTIKTTPFFNIDYP